MAIDLPVLLDRLCFRYPSFLVDAVSEHTPGERVVAVKNVTVNEEFFQGHFPRAPLMPAVLMIETLAQLSTVLLLRRCNVSANTRVYLRGVTGAKFRRQVTPGDRLRLEVTLKRARASLAITHAVAFVKDAVVAEMDLLLGVERAPYDIHPTSSVHPTAVVGDGSVIGPNVVIGPHVTLGRNCRVGASTSIEGWTDVGDDNEIYPFASIGHIPQDLKFHGERTRLVIGRKNVFREFVTIHRGTAGGGGVTEIGDGNFFMVYSHVAHDCRVGNHTIFGNGATLGGHVLVDDFATISAYSGVHQFCRVGRHAFVGGYSVVTKDALPFGKTVGNRARIFGLNTIGLIRRGFSPEDIGRLKRAYRYLLQSKLNASRALAEMDQDETIQCANVDYLIDFIRTSRRGVTLKRAARRTGDMAADESEVE